ncbi:type II secretion system protein [Cohnella hashimotonis]|uniref:Type II secretion system protein n=1 Tax=Cohnella hashimotonis TaxID=2826895 RepID=A0ABT6TDA9_9BACL|nr:type II secretion system protein [Cohnella hashimotonis]MDI4644320.1 type II secretion system protein [Cohnella hashimotonis]
MRTAVMKRLGKAKEDQKGFTLIELLAVIVILAVIAAIAVPLIGNIINKSKKDSDIATARQIYDAARLYVTSEEAGVFPDTIKIVGTKNSSGVITEKGLIVNGYLDADIVLPSSKEKIVGGTLTFTSGQLDKVTIVAGTGTKEETWEFAGADVIKGEGTGVKK